MFPILLLAAALVVAAAAPASQPFTVDVDKLVYELIKARENDLQYNILIPAVEYFRTDKMQIVVLALPYIPREDNEAPTIASAVLQSILVRNFEPLVDKVLKSRNVLFPYEKFRVRLVFIMFIDTQTLIAMGLDAAIRHLESPGGNPSAGRLFFISPILYFMSYNIEENSTKVNNIINNLQTYIKNVNSVIDSYQVCTEEVSYDGYKTFNRGGCTRVIECNTQCLDTNCTKTVRICTDRCSCNFNLDVNYKTLGSEGKAGDLEYRIMLERKIYNGTLESESKTCSYTFTPDNRSRRYFIDSFLNYYIPTPTQLKMVPVGYEDDQISETRDSLYNSISNYFEGKIRFNTLSGTLCDLDVINKTISQRYIEDIVRARDIIEREIRTADDAIIKTMIKIVYGRLITLFFVNVDFLDTIREVFKPAGIGCLENLAGKLVARVPVAGQIYALLHGVVGALQKQIVIEGFVQPPENIYKVTDSICRGGEITYGKEKLISMPSATEAILAGILGFMSSFLRVFFDIFPDFSEMVPFTGFFVDLIDTIPIVREVDIPQIDNTSVKYYYMITSRPGVYNITISVDIRSIIDRVIDDIITSIKGILIDTSKIVSENELIRVIDSALVLNIGDPYGVIKDEDIKNTNNMLTLNVTVISVPPYTYGGVSGGVIRYSYGYDLTGLLRSGAVTLGKNYTSLGISVGDIYNIMFWIFVERTIKALLSEINSILEKKIPGANETCSARWFALRAIMTVASKFVEQFADRMKDNYKKFIINLTSYYEGVNYDILLNGSSQQLELEEATYLVPHFLARKPVRPPESPTVRKCYGAVVTPYFRYKMPEVTQENFIKIILNNIDYISSDRCKGCGDSLLEILKEVGSLERRLLFIMYSFRVSGEQNRWKIRIAMSITFPPPLPPLSVEWGVVEGDAREVLTSDWFRMYLILLNESSVRNNVFSKIQENQFFSVLMNLAWDYRNVELPVVAGGFGVNLFFSAFRVYPAVVLREDLSNVYDNPYYFVLPYSVPTRELFVLGALDGRVLYDRGGVWELGGILYGRGQVGWSNIRPFYFVELGEVLTR